MLAANPLKPRGLLDMMGYGDSAFAGWLNPRRNAIMGFGAGLIGHDTAKGAMRGAAQGVMQGRQADTTHALLMQEQQERERQVQQADLAKNETYKMLLNHDPQIAELVRVGALTPAQGYTEFAKTQAGDANAWDLRTVGDSLLRVRPQTGEMETLYTSNANDSAREQQISRLMETGLDRIAAIGIVDGRIKNSVSPLTGEQSLIDLGDGRIIPLQQPDFGDMPAPPQPANGEKSLWSMADKATGVGSSMATTVSNTVGQLPGAIGQAATFEDELEAQQEFDLFRRRMIQSLALSPRYPIFEQQRIENMLPRGAFTSPQSLRIALQAVDSEFSRMEFELEQSINNPRTPVDVRNDHYMQLQFIRSARQRIGVPSGDAQINELRQMYGLE